MTYFGGTAPCYTSNYLSLAICKPLLRRTLARRFVEEKGSGNTYWFVGIAGKTLCYNKEFSEYENRVLYVAKLDDVEEYEQYFAKVGKKRRPDQIYFKRKDGPIHVGELQFDHVCNADPSEKVPDELKCTHDNRDYYKIDWSLDDKFKTDRMPYVLLSNHYFFPDKSQSKEIYDIIGDDKLAKGRGHRIADLDDIQNAYLEKLILSKPNHGLDKNKLAKYQDGKCSGCGRDRR